MLRTNNPNSLMGFLLFILGFVPTVALAAYNPSINNSPELNDLAEPISNTLSLTEQRYHYELAKSALKKKNRKTFEHYFNTLGDYPLAPYLTYQDLKQRLPSLPLVEIERFMEEHYGSYLEQSMRLRLLSHLAKRQKWRSFLNYYEPNLQSTALSCHALYARFRTGDSAALDEVAPLWNVGKSMPKACDKLFAVWLKTDRLTKDITWERFHSAMENSERGLARYVTSLMDKEQHQLAQTYQQVSRNPKLIKKHHNFQAQTLENQQIIAHGIRKLAKREPLEALYHWELYEAQQLFQQETIQQTKQYIVKKLIRKGYGDAAERLLSYSSDFHHDDLIEQLIRDHLSDQNWPEVKYWIEKLSTKKQQQDRWLYWKARAISKLGSSQAGDPEPKETYTSLASKRSFYGFLAADILNSEYTLTDIPELISHATLQRISAIPAMRRAKELWLTGNRAEARAEWLNATHKMETRELIAAGQLARRWGWYNKGIQATIAGNFWDHLELRFPLAYFSEVSKMASTTQIEPTFIYAIARQESAFAEDARSSAGAMGLMQLMPGTARQTAKLHGVRYNKKRLLNAEHNIMLGSQYLNYLLKQFGGNRILAAAAYNAGPHRVSNWINEGNQKKPFDIWIETIPFKETRHYVQNVLAYSVIYGYRLGKDLNLVTESEANRPL